MTSTESSLSADEREAFDQMTEEDWKRMTEEDWKRLNIENSHDKPLRPAALPMARIVLANDAEEARELRFEVFMDELEVHADPNFGEGKMPRINQAARALLDALEAEFVREGD